MSTPIVYFDLAGPDAEALKQFYSSAFGWAIDATASIAAASTATYDLLHLDIWPRSPRGVP